MLAQLCPVVFLVFFLRFDSCLCFIDNLACPSGAAEAVLCFRYNGMAAEGALRSSLMQPQWLTFVLFLFFFILVDWVDIGFILAVEDQRGTSCRRLALCAI